MVQPNPGKLFRLSLWAQTAWTTLLWVVLVWEVCLQHLADKSWLAAIGSLTISLLGLAAGCLFTILWPHCLLKRQQHTEWSIHHPMRLGLPPQENLTELTHTYHHTSLWSWWLVNLLIPLGFAFTLLQLWCLWALGNMPREANPHDHPASPE
ncbi:hypothetical protein [Oceanobacter mangrovi]|uniref:hypothetical protein n=1 Tax=Oceanobacter mangrovi TaxID=2862510 RepID=UPI001C8EFC20|nr:hypothetical protein [Oceanobacter mangrovi]